MVYSYDLRSILRRADATGLVKKMEMFGSKPFVHEEDGNSVLDRWMEEMAMPQGIVSRSNKIVHQPLTSATRKNQVESITPFYYIIF